MKFLMALLVAVLATSVPAQDLKPFTDAHERFEKDLRRITEPLYRRYVADLEKIKRDLGKAGDAKGAMTVQRELLVRLSLL